MKIKTDNKWRNFKYGYELDKKWRKEFDWMDDEMYMSDNFVEYKGRVYSLDDFTVSPIEGWDGFHGDSYFSGIVIKISSDGEQYKIGLALS